MGCDSSTLSNDYMIPDPFSKEIEGETIVHINNSYQNTKEYIEEIEKRTALDLIEESINKYSENPALGYRKHLGEGKYEKEYTWFTYSEIGKLSKRGWEREIELFIQPMLT